VIDGGDGGGDADLEEVDVVLLKHLVDHDEVDPLLLLGCGSFLMTALKCDDCTRKHNRTL
jgi:hypothetical protein